MLIGSPVQFAASCDPRALRRYCNTRFVARPSEKLVAETAGTKRPEAGLDGPSRTFRADNKAREHSQPGAVEWGIAVAPKPLRIFP